MSLSKSSGVARNRRGRRLVDALGDDNGAGARREHALNAQDPRPRPRGSSLSSSAEQISGGRGLADVAIQRALQPIEDDLPDHLESVTDVQGDNAGRQVVELAALESLPLEHRFQRLLIRMAANRFREVAVARGVVGEPRAESRQYLERIKIVERLQRSQVRLRELEHQYAAARLQHR